MITASSPPATPAVVHLGRPRCVGLRRRPCRQATPCDKSAPSPPEGSKCRIPTTHGPRRRVSVALRKAEHSLDIRRSRSGWFGSILPRPSGSSALSAALEAQMSRVLHAGGSRTRSTSNRQPCTVSFAVGWVTGASLFADLRCRAGSLPFLEQRVTHLANLECHRLRRAGPPISSVASAMELDRGTNVPRLQPGWAREIRHPAGAPERRPCVRALFL